jgi:hypothetical protein
MTSLRNHYFVMIIISIIFDVFSNYDMIELSQKRGILHGNPQRGAKCTKLPSSPLAMRIAAALI